MTSSFMSSTGFGQMTLPPAPAPARDLQPPRPGPAPAAPGGAGLPGFFEAGAPRQTVMVPGMAPPPPYERGMETPEGGLVPGHLPLRDSLDRSEKTTPYPAADRYDKPSFVRQPLPKADDWRAVGVGPRTDRKAPGRIAGAGPEQGRYMGVLRERLSGAWAGAGATGYALAAGAVLALLYALRRYASGLGVSAGAVVLLLSLSGAAYYVLRAPAAEAALGLAGEDVRDVSKAQKWQPLRREQPPHQPYPKILDPPQTTLDRMKLQGVDMDNVEGPRSDYRYKRGPTPGDQRRLQTSELMRTAQQYNMDEYEFNEYMARLEGEAPDQFYQAHAYMPFSAMPEHRQEVNDMDTYYGVSTQPGQMMRKSPYINPRMQQAGAKTSHLKDPPPGSMQPIEKTHPWMEKQLESQTGQQAFDMDAYAEQIQANGGGKVTGNQVAQLAAMREMEDRAMQPPGAQQGGDRPLPAELQPVPTTYQGALELQKKQQEDAQRRRAAAMGPPPPPHAQDNMAPAPQLHGHADGYYERESGTRPRTSGQGMGAPPMSALSVEERAEAEFAGAFQPSSTPSEAAVEAAMREKRS
jgi:hypothetical protein